MVAPGTALRAAALALSASAPVSRVSSGRCPPPPCGPRPLSGWAGAPLAVVDGLGDGSALAGNALIRIAPPIAPAATRPATTPICFARRRPLPLVGSFMEPPRRTAATGVWPLED